MPGSLRLYTEHSKITKAALRAEVATIRQRGVADCDQEIDIGIASMAAAQTFAMLPAGGMIAVLNYVWYFRLGLEFLSKTWFNLDLFWAVSLIVIGCFGIFSAYFDHESVKEGRP